MTSITKFDIEKQAVEYLKQLEEYEAHQQEFYIQCKKWLEPLCKNEDFSLVLEQNYSYNDYLRYLFSKGNREVDGPYFIPNKDGTCYYKNTNIQRNDYQIHHIAENVIPNLGIEDYAAFEELQSSEMLIYVTLPEHSLLHYLITKETRNTEPKQKNLGWGGLLNHHMITSILGYVNEADQKKLFAKLAFIDEDMFAKCYQYHTSSNEGYVFSEKQSWQKQRAMEVYNRAISRIPKGTFIELVLQEYIEITGNDKVGTINQRHIDIIYGLRSNNNNIMFIGQRSDTEQCYLLNGGKVSRLNNTPEWYLDKIDMYFELCKKFSSSLLPLLQPIIAYIKQNGGSGDWHGSIIDIDYFHHIKLDWENNTIIPYYAPTNSERIIVPTLTALLETIYNPNLLIEGTKHEQFSNCSKSIIPIETGIIGITSPYVDAVQYSSKKGFYSGNIKTKEILDSAENKIIKRWEDKYDNQAFWNNYNIYFLNKGE